MVHRFKIPNYLNEHEAFFNQVYSYIDEDGMIIQIDHNGQRIDRGACLKPGTLFLKLTNNLRYMFVLVSLFLLRTSILFPYEFAQKCIDFELKIEGNKTPN